jgi:hypothetical protein
MTASPVYQTSPIERTRATKAEVEARREALRDIIEAGPPMSVRLALCNIGQAADIWVMPSEGLSPQP